MTASISHARERTFGWCEQGGQTIVAPAVVNGPILNRSFQQSYPQCVVTVYYTGTTRLAALFSDDNNTVLGNPFTANANGYWFFYVDAGRYDVKFSQGGISTPFTLGDIAASLIGGLPFTINAATSPQIIKEVTHGEGPNVTINCFSGVLIFPFPPGNYGQVSGNNVLCAWANDGQGNIQVQWFDNTVGSIMISASGYGPIGPSGPAGYGAYPYTTNAGVGNTLLIPAAIHHQGTNVTVDCWSGLLNGTNITGSKVFCQAVMDPTGNGNVTVSWTGGVVGSIMVSASGRAQPFVINASVSPQTILVTTHKQGFTPDVSCWDGVVSGSATQGNKVYCAVLKDPAGDVTVTWGAASVKSIQIQ